MHKRLMEYKAIVLKRVHGRFLEMLFGRLTTKISAVAGIAMLCLGSGWMGSPALAFLPNEGPVPDHYIIQLRPNENAAAVANEMAFTHGLGVGHVYNYALNGYSARVPKGRLNFLRSDPRVISIVEDHYVSIAKRPGGGGGGSPSQPPQSIPTGILRINGDLSSTAAGNGVGNDVDVDVAVIDTGIYKHSDLNVVGGTNCSSGPSHKYSDGNGHGTHVAGTIGALDNNMGVVGVAPGARLWAVRVLNNAGSGTWGSVICGVDWVTANADVIEVANMSLGGFGSKGYCSDGGMNEAICNSVNAGVTYVVAAGNESDDAANHVPAAYGGPNGQVITVSALADFNGEPGGGAGWTCRADGDDTFANFSNWGSAVDIIAPGVCILSTWNDDGYNTISGTSMASPHVAGAAALYKANNPGATPAQVKAALIGAGNYNWNDGDDPDFTQEPLLDVGSL